MRRSLSAIQRCNCPPCRSLPHERAPPLELLGIGGTEGGEPWPLHFRASARLVPKPAANRVAPGRRTVVEQNLVQ
jgi:hypothetical protein